jgi:hypothetical protein
MRPLWRLCLGADDDMFRSVGGWKMGWKKREMGASDGTGLEAGGFQEA